MTQRRIPRIGRPSWPSSSSFSVSIDRSVVRFSECARKFESDAVSDEHWTVLCSHVVRFEFSFRIKIE